MPERPAKPRPEPPDLGWDELDEEEVPPPDPFDEVWPEDDEDDADWSEEPAEEEADEDDWADAEQADDADDADEAFESPGGDTVEEPEAWETEPEEEDGEEDWALELEGPVIVGWSERVSLPAWGIHRLPARCATDCETSTLYAELRPGVPGRVTLLLGSQSVDVAVGQHAGDLLARTVLRLGGAENEATLRLVATAGPPSVVVGRDVLAGRYLVDAARTRDSGPS